MTPGPHEAPPLTYEQTAKVLAKLANLEHPIVLVGGQAVNFWAEYYLGQGRAPELSDAAPFTSKDVDFCGAPAAVRECAARLGGEARLATLDDATPNTGIVRFVDDDGHERIIDFLAAPAGLEWEDTFETSREAHILDDAGRPMASFRVMHPVLCVESRAYNVAYLPGYDSGHALQQLRAAIVCAHEFVRDAIRDADIRPALERNERIFNAAAHGAGLKVFERHEIDLFAAVLVDASLPPEFRDKRYPQMVEFLARQRAKEAANAARARAYLERLRPQ